MTIYIEMVLYSSKQKRIYTNSHVSNLVNTWKFRSHCDTFPYENDMLFVILQNEELNIVYFVVSFLCYLFISNLPTQDFGLSRLYPPI